MQARLTLKIQFEKQIRRISVQSLAWESLKNLLKTVTEDQWNRMAIQYTDDEGDLCTISSNEELQESISLCRALNTRGPLLKLILVEDQPKPAEIQECVRAKFVEQLGLYPWNISHPLYNIACCDALLGDSESALSFLAQAIDAGFKDAEHLKGDEDLASIRDLDQFQVLLTKCAENQSQFRCPWVQGPPCGNFQKGLWFALQQQAISLMEVGTQDALEQARELFNKQSQLSSDSWIRRIPLYNIACCEALLGRAENALQYLRDAVKAGLRQNSNDHTYASIRVHSSN